MTAPLTPSATRTLLATLNHQPRHALGQNFLVDGNIVRKSLELAAIAPGDRVVEVGPGLGTLTEALLDAGAEVWAVERDRTLHQHLSETLGVRFAGRLHLVEGDAVDDPLAGFERAPGSGEFKIVANLPYAISTPWLDAVLQRPLPQRMVLMLQKEAAERYLAAPGTKQFGAISIFLQAAFEPRPGHPVAATCFHPRPEVGSQLMVLERRSGPQLFPAAAREFIRRCFQQRRKQLGAIVRGLPEGGTEWFRRLEAAGVGMTNRPEQIPVEKWIAAAGAGTTPPPSPAPRGSSGGTSGSI